MEPSTQPADARQVAWEATAAILRTLVPRPRLTVSQWADAHRVIPRGTSPEPGRWRTDRAPYLREIMDAVSDPAVERVYVEAASQVGKTEFLLGVIGFYASQDPSPILIVQPTEIAMGAFSKERIEPMFRASPSLRGLLSDGLKDPDNTIMLRMFPGGMLACAWATSSVSLASRPIRVVLLDEVDRFPDSIGRDGDPVAQAVQRTSNFANRKIVAVSTPTLDGLSAIQRLYEDTDQRRLFVPCPRCGDMQVLEWARVQYKRPDGTIDLDDVHYICSGCGGRIEERDRPEMLRRCEWRATETGRHRGYQLSALYSPWVRWRDLAEQWSKACADRDRRGMQEFVNLRLGEVWTEAGDQVHAEALEKNREDYDADIPDGALVLTAGVDVQDNRFEVTVSGWGLGKESWAIQYQVIAGDTSKVETWQRLDEFLLRSWQTADGISLGISAVCIDSGGHRTTETYDFCRPRLNRRVYAVKGAERPGLAVVSIKPTVMSPAGGEVLLYTVGDNASKEQLMSRLSLDKPGPGYCHFPRDPAKGFDSAFFDGLCSERRVRKIVKGRPQLVWKLVKVRNEALDVTRYAMAALEILNPNLEAFAEARAKDRQTRPAKAAAAPAQGAGGVIRRGRGIVSRGISV